EKAFLRGRAPAQYHGQGAKGAASRNLQGQLRRLDGGVRKEALPMTTRNSRDDEDHTPDPRALAKRLSNRHLINGQLAPSIAGKTFDVIYPATLEVIA